MNRCSPTLPLPGLVIKEDPYLGRQMLRSFCHLQTPLFLDALQQVHPGLARQIPVQAIAYGMKKSAAGSSAVSASDTGDVSRLCQPVMGKGQVSATARTTVAV